MPFIYGLVDSRRPLDIRYVGKTSRRLCDRLWDHKKFAKRKPSSTHRNNWVNQVVAEGGRIDIVAIEECSEAELNAREIFWIATYNAAGGRLTNHTAGGDGCADMDEATKNKLREYRKGRAIDSAVREKISLSLKGRPSPMTGRKHTEEAKRKMKGRAVGVARPAEVVERMARGQAEKIGKLTEADVRAIYARCEKKDGSQREIANCFGVSVTAVERIYAGRTWKFLGLTQGAA